MLQFTVDEGRCTRCGWCVRDCVAGIIERTGREVPRIRPEKEEECMRCQHCLAVCPTGAVSILGRDPARSLGLAPGSLPRLDQMERLVRGRRSVRHYRDENVDPELLRQLLAALANVPTGVNQRELTFHVMDDKSGMQRFRDRGYGALRAAPQRILAHLDYLRDALQAYDATPREDILMRGAPHVLVVSAPPDAPCPTEDVALTLAYFELLARSAGLGTVWCGLLKMLLETMPELKGLLGLPEKHVYYAMLFGVPEVQYARTVQRDDAAQVHRIEL